MKKKILLVEYCSVTIEAIKGMLHHESFEITIAKSEDTAMDLVEKNNFDLVITETLLPKSHGFILTQNVVEKSPGTKIIVISEKLKKDEYKKEALKYGASDFFEKPLPQKEFTERIFQLLNITEEDLEEDLGMTTNIHILPLLEDLKGVTLDTNDETDPGSGKNDKDIFGRIMEDVKKHSSYEIKLD